MQINRGAHKISRNLTNGPGKLCQAFQIDTSLNSWDVTCGQELWIEAGTPIPETEVLTGPRIGIDYAAPKDRKAPWRFWLQDNTFVSR